jgi:hypothetical protein
MPLRDQDRLALVPAEHAGLHLRYRRLDSVTTPHLSSLFIER